MLTRLARFVSRHWLVTILLWIGLTGAVASVTPAWETVTHDGDLAYMPDYLPSVQGRKLLEAAFPDGQDKSDLVVVVARPDRPIDATDLQVVRHLASRFHNLLGTSVLSQARQYRDQAKQAAGVDDFAVADSFLQRAARGREIARASLREAARLDPAYAAAQHNLAIVSDADGDAARVAELRKQAWDLDPQLKSSPDQLSDSQGPVALTSVWTRYTPQIGDRLVADDNRAELIVLRLAREFMATENIPLVEYVQEVMNATRSREGGLPAGLSIGLTGSAAVGGDMLISARESIANTTYWTVVLVVTILVVVYRAPLLVTVPIFSIVVSLVVATGLLAALTQVHQLPGMEWWDFKVFTTTKIFVVVILFGAGTDYCLFLIARYREELEKGHDQADAVQRALRGVGDALLGSALTTVLGLATMFSAEFGKFRHSGPAIGLCLLVTLLACVTLAPALLRGLGTGVFWPFGPRPVPADRDRWVPALRGSRSQIWSRLARIIVTRPGLVLVACVSAMIPLAILGTNVQVTYDLLSELAPNRASKQGARLLQEHFPVGESGPLIVLARKPGGDFDSDAGRRALLGLTRALYGEGIHSVRSLVAPTGKRPSRRLSIWDFAAQNYDLTRDVYLSKLPSLGGDVARFEVVLNHPPFSWEATQVLNRLDQMLQRLRNDRTSYWADSHFAFAGTTAGIRDLRRVTSADNVQIQLLVVLAVLVVLLLILRRPVVCLYLVLSVLFSYYVTIGISELFFRWSYGPTFEGLDWKVPLFLFVILVAIGQDYNIYLVTRVFEEQARHGLLRGLQRAVVSTGGIITSCGVIMAGTFVSMTTGTLRGVVELGFALSLGVLLDTFVVRPILVPAFLALLFRRQVDRRRLARA
jgi:RND superfamily putative drug exporter